MGVHCLDPVVARVFGERLHEDVVEVVVVLRAKAAVEETRVVTDLRVSRSLSQAFPELFGTRQVDNERAAIARYEAVDLGPAWPRSPRRHML